MSNDIGTMPGDPRPLGDSDYHANGKLKRVANPADGIIRTPAKSKAVTTPEKLERIKKVLEYRGRHLTALSAKIYVLRSTKIPR